MEIFKFNNRHVNDKGKDLLRLIYKNDSLELLKKHPNVKQLHITDITQAGLEKLAENFENQFDFIYFFKCPKIKDLSPISALSKIQYVSFSYNNKVDSLWDMRNNKNLKGIFINDFAKLLDLNLITTSVCLQEFHLSGGMWKNRKIDSLNSLKKLNNLKYLSLISIEILDNDFSPLLKLQKLRELRLSENTYDISTYAELAAKLKKVKCDCFKGYTEFIFNNYKTIQIVGKRKPTQLDPIKDAERIKKYIAQFEELKRGFAKV